ncbi:hypothetical protein CJD36_000305 [Flavipsychrobacter stenotrophus]|uniref:Transporter n=1 Tax=Flavipsychrobacter stenotrophus TaxID=2077091 RepID=A0A2S7T0E7_9BACT|nr:hypothetical protein [Flavipsychrobacter stenotrophus]PQJ12236.1 hypothetical protein CJD36_000305 [Flavipsychrobacter stenotrophus]
MKRIILSMLLAICIYMPAKACDVCGCSASNQFLGVLPGYDYNFIGLQYMSTYLSSAHPSAYENRPYEHSREYYNTFQVWGRYNMGKHYQLFAFVPYQYNIHRQDSADALHSGIGDISVLVNRILINKEHKKLQHQLLAGGGIKLPTGSHTSLSQLDKQGLPNMQPGTGSVDFMVNTNYTLRRKSAGINADAAYTFTTTSKDSYRYGNRLNAGAMAFYSFAVKKFAIMPVLGARYEYTLHDYDNYNRKWLNEQSGGYMLYATAGIQAYYKRLGARINYQLPLAQHYSSGYVTANYKVESGIFLLF